MATFKLERVRDFIIPNHQEKSVSIIRDDAPYPTDIVGQAISASGVAPMGAISSFLTLPGNKFNYSKAIGEPIANSAVAACMNWIMRTFPEAPIVVSQRDADSHVYIPDYEHPLLELLENPNPFYDSDTLWQMTLLSFNLSGNAYWLKRRNDAGEVVEIYYLPHYLIEPRWPINGGPYLSHYEYRPGNGKTYDVPIENIVHFRFGADIIKNERKGISQLASVLREIYSDNEATNFASALLRNMGVPGVIISPKNPDAVLTKETAEKIKDDFSSRFTGESRGEPLIMNAGIDAKQVSFTPQQLDLKLLHRLPEERICAALGLNPLTVGLGAGLDKGGDVDKAREDSYRTNIIPTQQAFAKALKRQLLPEFEADVRNFQISFDITNLNILQNDMSQKFTRVDMVFRSSLITRGEGRSMLGLPVDKKRDNLYFADIQLNSQLELVNANAEHDMQIAKLGPNNSTPSQGNGGPESISRKPNTGKPALPTNNSTDNARSQNARQRQTTSKSTTERDTKSSDDSEADFTDIYFKSAKVDSDNQNKIKSIINPLIDKINDFIKEHPEIMEQEPTEDSKADSLELLTQALGPVGRVGDVYKAAKGIKYIIDTKTLLDTFNQLADVSARMTGDIMVDGYGSVRKTFNNDKEDWDFLLHDAEGKYGKERGQRMAMYLMNSLDVSYKDAVRLAQNYRNEGGNDDKRAVAKIIPMYEKELNQKFDGHLKATMRTEIASAYNFGRRHAYEFEGVKEFVWKTRGDNRVRPAHKALEGKHFESTINVDGTPMKYPGDIDSDVSARVNCRCTIESS